MRTPTKSLFLHEEVMLLALAEEKGTVIAEDSYRFALGGAILAELLLEKRIAVAEIKKDGRGLGLGAWLASAFAETNLVDAVSSKRIGDPVLDECLKRVATAKRRASLKTWVQRFSNMSNLKHRVAEGLCDRGILRGDQDKVLLIFTRRIYPERDSRPERRIIERLRKAIFTEARDLDPRTVVLLSLADSANLLKIPFDKKKLRSRKKRIERITNGEHMGKATKEAVQAAQAAVAAAAIVPMIAVSAACH